MQRGIPQQQKRRNTPTEAPTAAPTFGASVVEKKKDEKMIAQKLVNHNCIYQH